MKWSIPEAWRGHQQQTNTTPDPRAKEMNTPCQGDANLETGGKETDLWRRPANSELQLRGVSKKAERICIACKEWLILFITVPCLQTMHTFCMKRGFFPVLRSTNTITATTQCTLNSGISAKNWEPQYLSLTTAVPKMTLWWVLQVPLYGSDETATKSGFFPPNWVHNREKWGGIQDDEGSI